MSSVGNPYHNAQAESFMKTLKVEEVYRAGYETFADVAVRLPIFIEQIYNTRRLHSALSYRTPEEFETCLPRKRLSSNGAMWPSPWGSLQTRSVLGGNQHRDAATPGNSGSVRGCSAAPREGSATPPHHRGEILLLLERSLSDLT